VDRYYVINVNSNGNSYRIGFYADSSPFQSSNISSLYPPTFYYESFTGYIVMGGNILKKIDVNLKTIMIRVDSYFNFYVGTSYADAVIVGNCTSYMNAINNDRYTLRWGYEIKSQTSNETVIDLLNGEYSNLINSATDGVTWPNYRLLGQSPNTFTISTQLSQSNSAFYSFIALNDSFGFTSIGTRTSFTLQCSSAGMDQALVLITPTTIAGTILSYSYFT
jgi:hypothetical protein